MALNFPSSPTNGQQYANWVYDSTKGAWEAKPLEAMAATPSPTAPLTPQSGDMWYNTNDGGVYVYYNDGNTSQWVQMKSDATLSSTLGDRTTTLENKLGLSRIIPPTVAVSGGSATANSLGTVSFTAVTSLSLNGVFTSAYDSYRILLLARSSVDAAVKARWRSAGVDKNQATYNQGGREERQNGVGGNFSQPSVTEILLFGSAASFGYVPHAAIDVYSPANAATGTSCISHASGVVSGIGEAMQTMSTIYTTIASIDGITIYPSTGNITGTIQVFGYNN